MHRLLLGYWARGEASPDPRLDQDRRSSATRRGAAATDRRPAAAGGRRPWHGLDALNDAIELDAAFAPDVGRAESPGAVAAAEPRVRVSRPPSNCSGVAAGGQLAFEVDSGAERRPGARQAAPLAMENDADRVTRPRHRDALVRQVARQPRPCRAASCGWAVCDRAARAVRPAPAVADALRRGKRRTRIRWCATTATWTTAPPAPRGSAAATRSPPTRCTARKCLDALRLLGTTSTRAPLLRRGRARRAGDPRDARLDA